jgi:hypothetical protein
MMPRYQKIGLMFLSLAICLAASTALTSGSAFAQCARPGFKLAHGYFNSTLVGFSSTTADFNMDGKIDLATVNSAGDRVSVFFGDGTGKLGAPTFYIPGASFTDVRAADMNNDGKPDLVVFGSQSFSTNVAVLLNNGNGTFAAAVTTNIGFNVSHQLADIDQDGRADLLDIVPGSLVKLQIRFGDGLGHFTSPTEMTPTGLGDFLVGDFNGDNKPDAVVTVYDSPTMTYKLQLYLNNGMGALVTSTITNLGSTSLQFKTARDFDGDGKLDLVGTGAASGTLSIFYNDGAGGFTRTDYAVVDSRYLVGDFDGNGKPDLLAFTGAGGISQESISSILFNNGGGNFTRIDYPALPVGVNDVVADFNNDGKDDLTRFIFARAVGQTGIQIWLRTCNYTLNTRQVDYDGDGNTDYAVWRPSTGQWMILQTASNTLRTQQWGGGSFGDVPVPGDYDGDGKSDLAVFRAPTGGWYVLKSSDNSLFGVQWGASGDKPVPGDYDADGKTDVAVFRPSDGGWYILRSSDGALSVFVFGTNGDKPAQADFDNDDKTDVAVFRPSNGYWYILKSSDGSFSAVNFGTNGDKPVPGDYDGDGKADIVVARAGVGWYILRSANNTFQGVSWGADKPAPGAYYLTGLMEAAYWDSSTGNFNVFPSAIPISVGTGGDIPVTAPYVIE